MGGCPTLVTNMATGKIKTESHPTSALDASVRRQGGYSAQVWLIVKVTSLSTELFHMLPSHDPPLSSSHSPSPIPWWEGVGG